MSITKLGGVILMLSSLALATRNPYYGCQIFEVSVRTPKDLLSLETLSKKDESKYDFIVRPSMKRSALILVNPEKILSFVKTLTDNSMEFKVINENVGVSLERDLAIQRQLQIFKPYMEGKRLGTERYYTHNEINSYITDLAKRYPKRAFVKTVGRTYEGRWMKTITITNGDGRKGKNVILMDGGFHAREWISPAAAVYIIGELVENFEENAHLLKDFDWVVLPVVNADGYEYTQISAETRFWRKTRQPHQYGGEICYGTDPNRNFGFHWNESGSSSYPCSDTYAGPKAFSEPETVTVRDLIHSFSDRGVMYLTLHSYGTFLLYPWGYAGILPDTWKDLDEVGKVGADAIFKSTGTEYTVGNSAIVLYPAAGASDDYAFHKGFKVSYTMELPGGGSNGFDPPPSSLDSYVKETWIGVHAMALRLIEKYSL